MAAIKAQIKKAFLQSIYDAVKSQTAQLDFATGTDTDDNIIASLEDGLKAFQRYGFSRLKNGLLSLGSSGMDHEVRWVAPDIWRSFTQEEVFGMAQEFREIYNDAVVSLGPGSHTDLQVLTRMMADDRLETVTSLQRDFTILRWNQRY